MAEPITQQRWQTLYTDHHGWLMGWLQRRLGCSWDAADLTQDTFVRALSRQPATQQIQEPRAFLTTIANGLVIDHWRRQRLERAYLDALAQVPFATLPSEEQRAEILETLVALDQMLDNLSPQVREAFLLAQLQGLTYKTIAMRLGVSERMVKKYMAKAMLHCLQVAAQ